MNQTQAGQSGFSEAKRGSRTFFFLVDLELVWDNRTYSMGILNATADSFSDGGVYTDVESALARAEEFVAAGCQILDVSSSFRYVLRHFFLSRSSHFTFHMPFFASYQIGGQSTRPGAEEIDPDTESKRVVSEIIRVNWISI